MHTLPGTGILSPPKSPDKSREVEDAFERAKEMADTKSASKCIRVMTVMTYVFSVSVVAILLSLYYVFVWDPVPPDLEALAELDEPDEPMAFRDARFEDPCSHNNTLQMAYMVGDEQENRRNNSGIEEPYILPLKSEEPVTESQTADEATEILLNYTSWNDTDQLSIPMLNNTDNLSSDSDLLTNSVMLRRLATPKPGKQEKNNT